MAKKKSFILYADYIKHIGKLTDEEAGRLFKAIFEYVNEGRLPDLDGMAAMAFSFISNQLDSDLQKYEETCKKRSENIKKRWEKANKCQNQTDSTADTKDTNEYKCIFCNTNDTDNGIDSDIDIENEIDIENDSDSDIDSDIDIDIDRDIDSDIDIENDSDSGSVLHNNTVPVPGTTTTNVHLTEKQYNDLCGKYGKEIIDRYIAKIGQYLDSNGKKPFPNHYETIVKWLTSDNIQPKRQPSFDIGRIMEHAKNNKPEV